MSAEKKHDYHLVDPSPWPIYVSFSCLVLALGSVYYMHSDVSWGMYLGLALLIYGAYMWFRDVVIEAEHQGHHTPVGSNTSSLWDDFIYRLRGNVFCCMVLGIF